MLILLVVALFANASIRQRDFRKSQQQIMHTLATSVANEVGTVVSGLHRRVKLFARDNLHLIETLYLNPDNLPATTRLASLIGDHFPNYFAFTITDPEGQPRLEDFDNLVGEICQRDIAQFAANPEDQTPIYIHPQPFSYHFDVITTWSTRHHRGIFFVSFHAELLARMLKNRQLPRFQLLLLKADEPHLIEVSAQGTRDQLKRPLHLSPAELQRIAHAVPVAETQWRLAVLPREDLFSDYRRIIILQSSFVLLTFLLICGVMMTLVAKQERQRNLAEAALRDAYERQSQRLLGLS